MGITFRAVLDEHIVRTALTAAGGEEETPTLWKAGCVGERQLIHREAEPLKPRETFFPSPEAKTALYGPRHEPSSPGAAR